MPTLSVALTGNPNTGKSTIFNELTGARQKIGNWFGVTVDKKVGVIEHNGRKISVIDLPGTYSINARSQETQSFKWMAFAFFYTCAVAWTASLIVYQGGKLLGFE